jgi:hypothetical protein
VTYNFNRCNRVINSSKEYNNANEGIATNNKIKAGTIVHTISKILECEF